ncbi:hypothetical protein QQS21_002892 [Conoideocrella luteorostrata]|uniref:chitinase n=1 Tax=Conoideocrella luteorostrata TaxID=1105319 RepID=A0AAJ0CU87_9HYPO|nr:hypothetical protein QQS21_002892 [Conoideocrella luteorostrata]
MRSDIFNSQKETPEFPLFTTVEETRRQVHAETKVMVAIGGWGDSHGFEEGNRDAASRARWCENVKKMIAITGADGVDIDWEYPGGNRDDYKLIPNDERVWEIEAFVLLLEDLRAAIGWDKILSIAVPGLKRDLMAFTASTIPRIIRQVDFINVMTYDLLNRRDTIVKHHSGVSGSLASIQTYTERGAPSQMLNLGLAYYVKWAMTERCDPERVLRCPTQLLEDPDTGADLGKTSAFSWHDEIPAELGPSFASAMTNGRYFEDGSFGYWDSLERRWWTFDTERVIERKLNEIVRPQGLGGVFAWGMGEDAPHFSHLSATTNGLRDLEMDKNRDEL